MNQEIIDVTPAPDPGKKQLTLVIYILYACSFFLLITAIIAIVLNYVKKGDVQGTWLESHFRWQIRTFWFGVLWSALGYLTLIILIGWVILFAAFVWTVYRLVKGIVNLLDDKPMYA